jgi:nucleotide-binding universal stress UspA family protein
VVFLYKNILLAIDDSTHSNKAIEKVIDLQKIWNCRVVMFHSIKHPTKLLLANIAVAAGSGSYYINESAILDEYKEEGDKILRTKQKIFTRKDLTVETRLITDEQPDEYIKRVVKEEQFDLVVIGTRGSHSKIKQVIIGSVAQKVVKHPPCDILIVR